MKVCPTCQNRYDQGEQFCPNDGTELVEADDASAGDLEGQTLAETVQLGGVLWSDELGERYEATLLETGREVEVRILNGPAEVRDDRPDEADALLDTLQGPVPQEISAVHSVSESAHGWFVIEEPPRGRTMRELLDDIEQLDWPTATRAVGQLAQALHWMAERGHVHHGLYPGNIRLERDDDLEGVQVGGWLQAFLTFADDPLETVDDESFVGFASYLSPESIRDEATRDERSLVYSLGMIYYEMLLGKPPFASGDSEEILKQHLYEKPVKLSIAAEDRELHPDVDDVLEMMWAKDPDERFQTPKAAIAALSNLVGKQPHEFSPVPSAAESPVFDHGEDASDDADAQPAAALDPDETGPADDTDAAPARPTYDTEPMDDEPAGAVSGSVEVPSADEGVASGSSEVKSGEASIETDAVEQEPDISSENPSIIIEDPGLESSDDPDREGDGEVPRVSANFLDWTDTLDPIVRPPAETPVLAGFDTELEYVPDKATRSTVATRNFSRRTDVDSGATGTAVGVDSDIGDDALDGDESPTELGVDIGTEIESPSDSGSDDGPSASDAGPPSIPDSETNEAEDEPRSETQETGVEADDAIVLDKEVVDEERPTEQTRGDDEGTTTSSEPDPSSESAPADDETFEAPEPGTGAATTSAGELSGTSSDVVREGNEADVSDEWFQVSDKEAWMAADVREERDRSEVIRRYATWGVFILIISAALALIVYSQTYTPADKQNSGQTQEQSTESE